VPIQAQPPLPPPDTRVYVTPDAGVYADPAILRPGYPIQGSVRLINPTSTDLAIKQTTDWFDASGLHITTVLSAPERMVVPRLGDAYIKLVAPTPNAVQFQVRVEPDLIN